MEGDLCWITTFQMRALASFTIFIPFFILGSQKQTVCKGRLVSFMAAFKDFQTNYQATNLSPVRSFYLPLYLNPYLISETVRRLGYVFTCCIAGGVGAPRV